MQTECSTLAAGKKDGGRHSGSGLQDQPSNRSALSGDKVSDGEQSGKRPE